MPRYTATLNSTWSVDRAFTYLSDFSNAQHWDPGVVAAARLDRDTVKVGSNFDLTVTFARRQMVLRYTVDAIEVPRRVVFVASTNRLESVDTLTFEETGDGCLVTYDADLRLKGVAALANPLLALVFRRVGDRARVTLARVLASD